MAGAAAANERGVRETNVLGRRFDIYARESSGGERKAGEPSLFSFVYCFGPRAVKISWLGALCTPHTAPRTQ